MRLNISINPQFRYASIWLTNEEQQDPDVNKQVEELLEDLKKQKYKLVIYKSGKGDLLEQTKGLLEHNKNVFNEYINN